MTTNKRRWIKILLKKEKAMRDQELKKKIKPLF